MKIAYIIAHLGSTGVNRVVLDLIHQMKSNGHHCDVFFLNIHRQVMDYPCNTIKLTDWNELSGYDIIHAHGLKPELFVLRNRLNILRNRKKNTVYITTLHCYCFQDLPDLYGEVKGFFMGCLYLMTKVAFDKVVCLSKDMMLYYKRWIPQRRLTYVYNTRDVDFSQLHVTKDEMDMLLTFKGDSILIGMNCVLIYRKGIDIMLKALVLLPDNYKLIVMGEGKEKKTFQQMIHNLGLDKRVLLAGQHPDAFRFLPYYDIYAMPSRSEGFPLVLLEAAACGAKVVASRLPVVKECFEENEVITFDMPDESKLAEAIIKAHGDKDLGLRLKNRFERDYSPKAFYQNYLRIYEKI